MNSADRFTPMKIEDLSSSNYQWPDNENNKGILNFIKRHKILFTFLVLIPVLYFISSGKSNGVSDNKKNIDINNDKKNYNIEVDDNNKTDITPSVIPKDPPSSTTVAICMIVKHEKKYILEFLEYYRKLNFTKIIMFDNNENDDDENIYETIKPYVDSGFVQYRADIKDKKDYPNFQIPTYEKCYRENMNKYDWIYIIDTDEFLVLSEHDTIQGFVDENRYKKCNTIRVNFRVFSDNNLLRYEDKPVRERFTQLVKEDVWEYDNPGMKNRQKYNSYVKTLIRGGLKNARIGVHGPILAHPQCRSNGEVQKEEGMNSPIDYRYAALNHYYFKSTEEFIDKMNKTRFDKGAIKLYISQRYFYFNERTLEKIEMLEKGFGIELDWERKKLKSNDKNN